MALAKVNNSANISNPVSIQIYRTLTPHVSMIIE